MCVLCVTKVCVIVTHQALADESEFVRDTALRAGQRIVNTYADSAVELLLPELENGLFNDNWRIRYSSVQLLGDLLYRLSGKCGDAGVTCLSSLCTGVAQKAGTRSHQFPLSLAVVLYVSPAAFSSSSMVRLRVVFILPLFLSGF